MNTTASLNTEKIKDTYETLSGKASDIFRQLSLAGIALIWLFKVGKMRGWAQN